MALHKAAGLSSILHRQCRSFVHDAHDRARSLGTTLPLQTLSEHRVVLDNHTLYIDQILAESLGWTSNPGSDTGIQLYLSWWNPSYHKTDSESGEPLHTFDSFEMCSRFNPFEDRRIWAVVERSYNVNTHSHPRPFTTTPPSSLQSPSEHTVVLNNRIIRIDQSLAEVFGLQLHQNSDARTGIQLSLSGWSPTYYTITPTGSDSGEPLHNFRWFLKCVIVLTLSLRKIALLGQWSRAAAILTLYVPLIT